MIVPQNTILCFGELLWDLFPTGRVLGGAPANLAYRLSALGHRARLISRVGADQAGVDALDQLRREGMDLSLMQTDAEHPTGTVQVLLDELKNLDYFIVPNASYDFIEPTAELLESARVAEAICFGTLAQRSETSRATLAKILEAAPKALKVLDINLRKECHTPETVAQSLARADILKLNETEALHLAAAFSIEGSGSREIARGIVRRWDLDCCVVTLGERGAFALARGGEEAYEPGIKVELADACGSGDAFTAAFLHGWLRNLPLAECCRRGNLNGAVVATQHGAMAPIRPADLELVARCGKLSR